MEPKAPETTPEPAATPAPTTATPASPTPPVSNSTSTTAAPASEKGSGHSSLIAIILLLLLYPIGVLYMLMKTNWPKWLKILLCLPILLGILGGIIFAFKSILFH